MAPVFPCYASENSLLRSRREFASKPLLQRRVFRRRRRRSAPILQKSLLFSLLAGNFRPETGSLETAPSATPKNRMSPSVGWRELRHLLPLSIAGSPIGRDQSRFVLSTPIGPGATDRATRRVIGKARAQAQQHGGNRWAWGDIGF